MALILFFLLFIPLALVGYFAMKRMEGKRGAGRVTLAMLVATVYVPLAFGTTPLFALAPTAVMGVAGVVGIVLNHMRKGPGDSGHLPW